MIYKRGSTYWTKFQHAGRMIYKSTGQTSATKARQVEARLRSELALGHFGILKREAIPTLSEFIKQRIEPKLIVGDENAQPRQKRFRWLRCSLKPLASAAIGRLPLNEITSEHVLGYADARLTDELSVGTVNRELRAVRRCLRLAVEWGVLEKAPRVSMAGKEPGRERVVSDVELSQYLRHASPLLADVAVILNETGLRPDELHRLAWEDLNFAAGRYGTLRVHHGKTAAARRTLPMTAKVRCILGARHVSAGSPALGWVFPAPSTSGHLNHSSLRKAHAKALESSKVAPFLLYSLRHTFATRIAPHVDAWTLCKIMGWASLSVANRYIHPSEDRVLAAFGQQPALEPELSGSGDKTGDTQQITSEQQMLELSPSSSAAIA
jgi:integrase